MFETELPVVSSSNNSTAVGDTGGGVADGGGGFKDKSNTNTAKPTNGHHVLSGVDVPDQVYGVCHSPQEEVCQSRSLKSCQEDVDEVEEAQESIVDQNKEAAESLGLTVTNGSHKVVVDNILLHDRSVDSVTDDEQETRETQLNGFVSSEEVQTTEEVLKEHQETAQEDRNHQESPVKEQQNLMNGVFVKNVDKSFSQEYGSQVEDEEDESSKGVQVSNCKENIVGNGKLNGSITSQDSPTLSFIDKTDSNGFAAASSTEETSCKKEIANGQVKASALEKLSEKCLDLFKLINFFPGEQTPFVEEIANNGIIVLTSYRLVIITRRNNKIIERKNRNHNQLDSDNTTLDSQNVSLIGASPSCGSSDCDEDEEMASNQSSQTNGANDCKVIESSQVSPPSLSFLASVLVSSTNHCHAEEASSSRRSDTVISAPNDVNATQALLDSVSLSNTSCEEGCDNHYPFDATQEDEASKKRLKEETSSSTSPTLEAEETTTEIEKVFLPVGSIDSLEIRDNNQLHLLTKHVKCFICFFNSSETCNSWFKRINDAITYQSKMEHLFCFKFWKCVSCNLTSNNHSTNHVASDSPLGLRSSCPSIPPSSSLLGNGSVCHSLPVNDVVPNGDTNSSESTERETTQDELIRKLLCASSISSQPQPTTNQGLQSNGIVKNGGAFNHKEVFDNVLLYEFERMEFGPVSCEETEATVNWRMTDMNRDFKAFPTYPSHLIVPKGMPDEELSQVASFRSFRRIPAIVWRSRDTGCIIARSSQPEIGWFGWRSGVDEKMISEITVSSSATKLLILDARSYAAAVANRAKGGGCECNEYYPTAEVQFMGLANIHSIRKSFQCIRYLCQFPSYDPSNWSNQIDSSRWLHHISGLIKSSLLVVNAVRLENKSVLVHCSDGWDRTPQITALAQLLLDPFYRSTKGFLCLIQKEWLEFGHKFYDRGSIIDDPNERCPVFLQWIDCVHQIVKQFPSAFEFNMQLLVSFYDCF